MTKVGTLGLAPSVIVEQEQRRQSIIEDYKSLWIQIYNDDMPQGLVDRFNEADINILIRQFERERVQHMQDGLY